MPSPYYPTLTANTVATVDVTADLAGGTSSAKTVKVTTDDQTTAHIYFRTDGVAPTVAGSGCEVLLAGGRGWETSSIVLPRDPYTGVASAATVKLISAAGAWVKVEVN